MVRPLAALLTATLSVVACEARGEDFDRALRLRVNPTSYDRGVSSLEEKVARRMREMDYKFRMICRGCLSAAAEANLLSLRDPNARLVPVDDATAPAGVKAPTSAATAPP